MAARFPEPSDMDPVEAAIKHSFDNLVLAVNKRRVAVLLEYRRKKEELRAESEACVKSKEQLLQVKEMVGDKMEENILHSLREDITGVIDTQLQDLKATVQRQPMELCFQIDPREVEETISQLGQLIMKEVPPIPNYPALTQPRISICEKGEGPGQLNMCPGLAFCETKHLIYVPNYTRFKSGRVSIFSEEGKYIKSFGRKQLTYPEGIGFYGDNLYVSDSMQCAMFLFKLPDYRFISRVGEMGSGQNQFRDPGGIYVTSNGDVYLADSMNNRVVVMDCDLQFKQIIQHSTMTEPSDLKFLKDELYVLSDIDNPVLHVFSRAGDKIRSLITHGQGGNCQVELAYCFCFDQLNNILIGDYIAGRIKVFSQEGVLLHTLGGNQKRDKKVSPESIVLTPSNKIICTSSDTKFRLHMYY